VTKYFLEIREDFANSIVYKRCLFVQEFPCVEWGMVGETWPQWEGLQWLAGNRCHTPGDQWRYVHV